MTRAQLIQTLRQTGASNETLCHVMHVWPEITTEPTLDQVIDYACQATGLLREIVLSGKRKKPAPETRYIIMHYLNVYRDYNLTQIGNIFNRDHTTVIHGVQVAKDLMSVKDRHFMYYHNRFIDLMEGRKVLPFSPPLPANKKKIRVIKMYLDKYEGIYYSTVRELGHQLGYISTVPSYDWLRKKYPGRIERIIERV